MVEQRQNYLKLGIRSMLPFWGSAAYLAVLWMILHLHPWIGMFFSPERYGYTGALLRTTLLNYILFLEWAIIGIPTAVLLIRILIKDRKLPRIGLTFAIVVFVVFIPYFTLEEYGVLDTIHRNRMDLSLLEQGAHSVYEGRFSEVQYGGGPFPGQPSTYVLRFRRGETYCRASCSIREGRQVELYTYSGGQAKGQDTRRFRIEYLEHTGVVLSIELLDS